MSPKTYSIGANGMVDVTVVNERQIDVTHVLFGIAANLAFIYNRPVHIKEDGVLWRTIQVTDSHPYQRGS